MQTRTIDEIVRTKLSMYGYPMHYYLTFLLFAHEAVKNLSESNDIGLNIKEEKLTALDYGRVAIPAGAIDVIGVYGILGGERKHFFHNPEITAYQKLVSAAPAKWLETDSSLPELNGLGSSLLLDQIAPNEYPTVYFPDPQVNYEYGIDYINSQVVLGPRVDVTEIYLMYLANGISSSAVNLVHPYASDVIYSFIDYKLSELQGRAQSESMRKRSDWMNEKRLYRGKVNTLKTSDLYQILATN